VYLENNDLNLKIKPLVRQSIQTINNNEQQDRTKHSNNSSKENIDDENEAASDENVILNKRKCSVNLDELKRHLHNLAKNSCDTNMKTKNLAIVWAPNLLKYKIIFILTIINSISIDNRSKEMDGTADVQYNMLYSIRLQANIAEFSISNADTIFDDKFSSLSRRLDLNTFAKTHRPISVCHTTGAKLLSLEEAQARDKQYKQVGPLEVPKFHTVIANTC
jgi:hypothetical protein